MGQPSRVFRAPSEGPRGLRAGAPAITFVFVWGVWALMVLGNLALIVAYRSKGLPFMDEWDLLVRPMTLGWLWEQHAEHRIPLAKLVWTSLLWLTGYDFRLVNCLSALTAAAVAFAFVRTAKRLRGRLAWTDAFFPVAILSFGQGYNFYGFWQVNHLVAAYASCALLLAVARGSPPPGRRAVALLGALLVVLPFCGPGALPYAAMTALWLGGWGAVALLSREFPRRRLGFHALGLAALGALLVGLYFWGYHYDPNVAAFAPVAHPGPAAALVAGAHAFGVSLGSAAFAVREYAAAAVIGLVLASLAVLAVAWRRRPAERFRILGLAGFLAATCALMLVVGWARAGIGEAYIFLNGQFLAYAVPALLGPYLVWQLYGPRAGRWLVQGGLLVAVCAFSVPNLRMTQAAFRLWHAREEAFVDDLKAGAPPEVLAQNHALLMTGKEADDPHSAEVLRALHRKGIGLLRQMRLGPPAHPAGSCPVPGE